MLYYFKDRSDTTPIGVVPLRRCQIAPPRKVRSSRPFSFELDAVAINKVFQIQAKSQQEADNWIKALQNAADFCLVSNPYNVKHNIHADYNATTGLTGLPPDWEALLQSSQISKQEVLANPTQVIEVLQFDASGHVSTSKPEARSFKVAIQQTPLEELVRVGEPQFLQELAKIEAGIAGGVYRAKEKNTGAPLAVRKITVTSDGFGVLGKLCSAIRFDSIRFCF